jgi:hypothetical protein
VRNLPIPVTVIANKCDSLGNSDLVATALEAVSLGLGTPVLYSAETQAGTADLYEALQPVIDAAEKKLLHTDATGVHDLLWQWNQFNVLEIWELFIIQKQCLFCGSVAYQSFFSSSICCYCWGEEQCLAGNVLVSGHEVLQPAAASAALAQINSSRRETAGESRALNKRKSSNPLPNEDRVNAHEQSFGGWKPQARSASQPTGTDMQNMSPEASTCSPSAPSLSSTADLLPGLQCSPDATSLTLGSAETASSLDEAHLTSICEESGCSNLTESSASADTGIAEKSVPSTIAGLNSSPAATAVVNEPLKAVLESENQDEQGVF